VKFLSTAGELFIWACLVLAPLIILRAALRKLSARKARRAPSSAHPAVRFHVPKVTDAEIKAFLDEAIEAHGEDGCHG
jgi:hypothetical protein